ncbi:phosphotransferase [Alteribacillus sp. HJP-4]|uniref:phosphotransferase n=1 Tax=Alteribacillus sp. HJP-4 TaxID=2775394 RepID=UPI0035CCE0B5
MNSQSPETIAVRKGEELNVSRLENFLHNHLNDLPEDPLTIEQFPSGHSNLTYLLKKGSWEAVLRRPPLGPVAEKAHNMKRESEVLKALHPLFPLAPRPYLYCEDSTVAGREFFIMERRRGAVIDSEFPSGMEETPENGRSNFC